MKQYKKEKLISFELVDNKDELIRYICPSEANTIEKAIKIGQRYAQYHPDSLPISIRRTNITTKTVRILF